MGKTVIMDHPLVKHKISLLRDVNTGTKEFRLLVNEITMLMGYEAMRDLPVELVPVTTPVAETVQPMLTQNKLIIVPILRAGLGMVNGLLDLVPTAKVGHIGLARDEGSHQPYEYYCKLPKDVSASTVILPDPMLATGGSAVHAVRFIKENGCRHIKFMCIIAAPEGLKALEEAHPDIDIYVGALDEGLNENAYIIPGLGDAGDRIFGTL